MWGWKNFGWFHLPPLLKSYFRPCQKNIFPKYFFQRQSLKIFTFRVKSSDSICFLLGSFPYRQINLSWKVIFLSLLRITTPTQLYLVWIRFPLLRLLLFIGELKSTIILTQMQLETIYFLFKKEVDSKFMIFHELL